MSIEDAVAALDAINTADPEEAHCDADRVLLEFVPVEVQEAYARAVQRAGDWWYA